MNFGLQPDLKYQADLRDFSVFGDSRKGFYGFSYRGIRITYDSKKFDTKSLPYLVNQIDNHKSLNSILEEENRDAKERLFQMIGLESKFNNVTKFLDENEVESILRLTNIKQAPKFWMNLTTKKKEVQKLETYLSSFKEFHEFVMASVEVGYEIAEQINRINICPTYEKSLDDLINIQENILYLQSGIISTAENKLKSFERLKIIF